MKIDEYQNQILRFELVPLNRVLAQSGLSLKDQLPSENTTLGEALMAPTVIYVKQVFSLTSISPRWLHIAMLTNAKT